MENGDAAIIADPNSKGYDFAIGVYNHLLYKPKRDFEVDLVTVKREDFKDGEFKLRIAKNVRRRQCYLIHDSNKSPSDWYTELNFVLDALKFSSPEEINVVLPYTRFARQERKDESRVSVNAKALAKMISTYADRAMTVDLHNPAMQGFFDIPFDNLYSFPTLIDYLGSKHPLIFEDLAVVSPDMGGAKRVRSLAKRLRASGLEVNVAIGDKIRLKDNVVDKVVIIGDVKDRNCLIVDDMIDTGGTIAMTEASLRENGAKSVYAYGTHGLFSAGLERFSTLDKLFVSDTLVNSGSPNLETISLIPLFGEAIYRTIKGDSLSALFDSVETKR
ncbi:MAG: ribose-phosphate diphosphokinase [Nanoarchaeota archaeon]